MTPDVLAATHAAAFQSDRAWSASEFQVLLAQPGMILRGDPRSFVLGRVTLDEAEVLTLATRPEARRRGLARAAIRAMETEAVLLNAARVFLEVAEDNLAAIALYRSCHFEQVGRRSGYYARRPGPKVAALVMEKRLFPD